MSDCRHKTQQALMRGTSLVELLIGMVIALLASIVIFQVFSVSESYKRSTTGGSDALQSGGFSAFALSRVIGLGGAGFVSTPGAVGCALGVFRGTTQLFGQGASPYRTTTALPAPFEAAINFKVRLAPVLIVAGADANTPDIIMVMAGHHPSMGRHNWVLSQAVDSITLADSSVVGINNSKDSANVAQHDLLLAIDQDPGSGRGANTTCDIAEAVESPSATAPFAVPNPVLLSTGANFSGPNRFKSASNYYSTSLLVANLGPVSATAPSPSTSPQFVLLGVGNDGTTPNSLLSLNMITGFNPVGGGGWVPQSLADNIVSIKAIYGVAGTPLAPNVSSWVDPTGGTWGAAALSANRDNLLRIRAIRLAVIARNAQPEKAADTSTAGNAGFSPATFTLFGDTSVSKSVTNPDRHYRYKIFDITIPLRNMVLMTQNP
ncbi:MAG: PilW family protein [Rhodocyclaceae bacterium]|nr:PilW family protein [Rhodocyclaceae bacterium]